MKKQKRPAARTKHPHTVRNILELLILMLLAYGAIAGVFALTFDQLPSELLRSPINDANIYAGVGRGIINGLRPYIDLFECKPPGIFLLAALSWKLVGSIALCNTFTVTAICLVLFWFAYSATTHRDAKAPLSGEAFRALLGILLGSLTAMIAGLLNEGFQTEIFGVVFCVPAILLLASDHRRPSAARSIAAACFLALSLFIKEPFLFIFVAAFLLLWHQGLASLRSFIVVTALGLAIDIALIAACGVLPWYVSRSLIQYHIGYYARLGHTSSWFSGLGIDEVARTYWHFSPMYAITIGLLVLATVIPASRKEKRSWMSWATGIVALALSLYITTFSILMTGYHWPHYFVLSIPIVFTAWVVWDRRRLNERAAIPPSSLALALVLCFALFRLPHTLLSEGSVHFKTDELYAQYAANRLDLILDQCGDRRYLSLANNATVQPYTYTLHSPIGPYFFQLERIFPHLPDYGEDLRQELHAANLIVSRQPEMYLDPPSLEYLHEYFTEQPWRCAGPMPSPLPLPGGFHFYFRTQRLPLDVPTGTH